MEEIISYKDFIVEFNQAYENQKKIGELELVMNVDNDNIEYVNRECSVVGLPYNYKGSIKVGDRLIVHHNIARISKTTEGENLNYYKIRKNIYRVPDELVFLYRSSESEEWKSYGNFCFILPIEETLVEKIGSIYVPSVNQEKYVKNTGLVAIENFKLNELGVKKGDKIYFKNFSEHKYEIDGKILYKMDIERVIGLFE